MRILFDQGVPVPVRDHLHKHTIETAYERGWDKLSNGDLLAAAEIVMPHRRREKSLAFNRIARQRRRVGDLGENVAEVFGAARLARASQGRTCRPIA